MSERSNKLLITDILTAIEKISDYTEKLNADSFQSDYKTQDAVSRNFMVIGEAASRVSDEYKSQNPAVPWRILKDFRNKIIHEYFGVDYSTVWTIIQRDLPTLKSQLETLITPFD